MLLDDPEILDLLHRVSARDQQAIRALYVAFNRRIYAFALNRLQDPADAEQVVLDTMLEVWNNPERFRGESRFGTWVLGIARHKILDTLRGRGMQHEDIGVEVEQIAAEDAGGYDVVLVQQHKELVRQCMNRLPEEQRECVHLAFFEDLPLQQIARVQNCPENTVKTRLFHARAKMKACLSRLLGAH